VLGRSVRDDERVGDRIEDRDALPRGSRQGHP
jgi:hypothetical protein